MDVNEKAQVGRLTSVGSGTINLLLSASLNGKQFSLLKNPASTFFGRQLADQPSSLPNLDAMLIVH